MYNKTLQYCATDKEVFDLLMSSKKKLTASVLLEIAKDRGIFYSPQDSREALSTSISLLPHDHYDLSMILEQRDSPGRAEKLSSITLNTSLTMEDVKEASSKYKEESHSDENVISHQEGSSNYVVNVIYSELDYSRNRLSQRKQKEAKIEFIIDDEKTVVRMPANVKAESIVSKLKDHIDAKKKENIPSESIELVEFERSDIKTKFFTKLIKKLPGFKLDNVTSIKVESNIKEQIEEDLDIDDDQDTEEAKEKMLALVRNVALKGESLLASSEYQQLNSKGFFITSIFWRSKQTESPYSIVEWSAGFQEPEVGKGFKYNIRGEFHCSKKGHYTKTLRPVEADHKQHYLTLLEETARQIIQEFRDDVINSSASGKNLENEK